MDEEIVEYAQEHNTMFRKHRFYRAVIKLFYRFWYALFVLILVALFTALMGFFILDMKAKDYARFEFFAIFIPMLLLCSSGLRLVGLVFERLARRVGWTLSNNLLYHPVEK